MVKDRVVNSRGLPRALKGNESLRGAVAANARSWELPAPAWNNKQFLDTWNTILVNCV